MPLQNPRPASRVPDPASPIARVMARVDAGFSAPSDATSLPAPDGVATGFPSLDRLLGGGVRSGDLVVIGGDVGSGKSAFALAVALRAARGQDGAVAFLSGEMTEERVAERVLAIEGRARVDDLRQGGLDDATRAGVGAAALRLRDMALSIGGLPVEGGVEALADELRRTLDLRLAVIDGLESLAPGARPRAEELAAAAARLKRLALELGAPLVVTAQLPALERGRSDLRPCLDDFGALGAVSQHADVVLALFREEMYSVQPGVDGATELLVLKNRNGPAGYADLYFYKQWMRFEDMLEPDR